MDEFSQVKAENAEIATDMISLIATFATLTIGMGAGAVYMRTKGGKARMEAFSIKHPKLKSLTNALPEILASLLTLPVIAPIVAWTTKNEILASKIGRYEAIKTELNSENQFAILDENQNEELNKKVQNTLTENNSTKKEDKVPTFKEALATLNGFVRQNEEVQEYIKAQNKQFEDEKLNFNKPLSEEEIKNAKEDREMITRIVEEIDKVSQDYNEDVEFGTNTIVAFGAVFGAAAGFITNGVRTLIKKIKSKNIKEAAQKTLETTAKTGKKSKILKFLPAITGLIGMMAASFISAKLQNQSSRVARFKVMQDFKNNPEKLIYVDEDKLKDIEVPKEQKEEKNENLLQFYTRLFRENTEYNKYKKENGEKEKQLKLKRNEIKLTEKQKADAKKLQENVFKTFNKIDDKSQTYSESTEALGLIIKQYGDEIISTGGCLISTLLMYKNRNKTYSSKSIFLALLPAFVSTFAGILLNSFVTKEQKKSSRVAHMLAIKDLEDYRHFANYNNQTKQAKDKTQNSLENKTANLSPVLETNKPSLQKMQLDNVFKNFTKNK